MRKLTGYIGAMIIVFALAGSVLLGFVLNVTNDPVVKDNYETITDVSGLYSHSSEETYIDYNPASNYTNYILDQTPTKDYNVSGYHGYKKLTNSTVLIRLSDGHIIIDGVDNSTPPWPSDYFVCDSFYIDWGGTAPHIWPSWGSDATATTDVNITVAGNSTTISYNGITKTVTTSINIAHWAGSDWDYWINTGNEQGNTTQYGVFINSINQIVTIGFKNHTALYVSVGNTLTDLLANTTPYNISLYNGGTYYAPGVNYQNVNYSGTVGGVLYQPYFIFYPRYVEETVIPSLGIDYTVSSKVNNYPVTSAYDSVISKTKTLSNSLTQNNYAVDIMMLGNDYYATSQTPQPDSDNGYQSNGYNYAFYQPYKTTLATILNAITLDGGTTSVTFTNKSGSYITTPAYTGGYSGYGEQYHWGRVSTNAVWFCNPDTPTHYTYNSGPTWGYPANCTYINDWTGTYYNTENRTQQLIYDVSRGLVDFYANDVKIGTYSPSDITVLYGGSTIQTNNATYFRNGQAIRNFTTGSYAFSPSITTELYYTEYTSTPAVYLDPTEGIKIDNSNTFNVNWSNGYRNSDIQILFRIINQGESYANDIIVGNDTVKVSSDGYRFYIQINNDTPVDIGNWRNIVLDLDVINGQVKALPVRTFNNFTNVRLYNDTDVYVGQLSDKQTVNSLAFSPTNKSFTFSIYNTKVFMDTYGVVMVNPSINVTDYFTNLDGFYKIKMDKFSLIGNSITINGQTFDIINNKIRIENSDQKITDMDIFYKNGQCSVYFAESDTTISLGNVVTNAISMTGNWYFTSVLYKGSEITDREYTWHIEDFVMNNGQFVVIYLGLLAVCYVAARKFCVLTITDYLIMIASIIIALGVQLI